MKLFRKFLTKITKPVLLRNRAEDAFIDFLLISHFHFRSHFSQFQINTQLLFLLLSQILMPENRISRHLKSIHNCYLYYFFSQNYRR